MKRHHLSLNCMYRRVDLRWHRGLAMYLLLCSSKGDSHLAQLLGTFLKRDCPPSPVPYWPALLWPQPHLSTVTFYIHVISLGERDCNLTWFCGSFGVICSDTACSLLCVYARPPLAINHSARTRKLLWRRQETKEVFHYTLCLHCLSLLVLEHEQHLFHLWECNRYSTECAHTRETNQP